MYVETINQAINNASVTNDSYSFRRTVLDKLRSYIPFEAACFTTVDPQSLLSTGALTEDRIEALHPQLFENEYLKNDFNQYVNLAKSAKPVASLSLTTNGKLEQSLRYCTILQPAGFADELRAALVFQGKCWGFLTLYRSAEQSLFRQEEIEFVNSLLPSLAQSLQSIIHSEPSLQAEDLPETGVMIISNHLELLSSNSAANKWLSLLREWEQLEATSLPRPIRAVCSQAKSNQNKKAVTLAKVCIRTPIGAFLSIQASEMDSFTSENHFSVICEQAKPQDFIPLIIDYYGLSYREKQILECVLRGDSTKEIAHNLFISTYTVQDHLKSIFQKTGVSSRRELIWLLFTKYIVKINH